MPGGILLKWVGFTMGTMPPFTGTMGTMPRLVWTMGTLNHFAGNMGTIPHLVGTMGTMPCFVGTLTHFAGTMWTMPCFMTHFSNYGIILQLDCCVWQGLYWDGVLLVGHIRPMVAYGDGVALLLTI